MAESLKDQRIAELEREVGAAKERERILMAACAEWKRQHGEMHKERADMIGLLRRLVDSEASATVEHGDVCAGKPPHSLDGKCPACMFIHAWGEARAMLGLPLLESPHG